MPMNCQEIRNEVQRKLALFILSIDIILAILIIILVIETSWIALLIVIGLEIYFIVILFIFPKTIRCNEKKPPKKSRHSFGGKDK